MPPFISDAVYPPLSGRLFAHRSPPPPPNHCHTDYLESDRTMAEGDVALHQSACADVPTACRCTQRPLHPPLSLSRYSYSYSSAFPFGYTSSCYPSFFFFLLLLVVFLFFFLLFLFLLLPP